MATVPIDISGRGDTYSQYPIDVAKTRPRYWYEPDENGYTASMPDLADPNLSGQYNDWNPYVNDPSRGYQAQPVVPTATTPTPKPPDPKTDPGPGAGGPGPTGGAPAGRNALTGLFDPYGIAAPTPNLTGGYDLPAVPQFNAPGYTPPPAFSFRDYQAPDAFKAPTMEEALNEPGYQFRVQQGNQAIQNSAAARGNLLGGNTVKGLSDYNQNAASQEYGNVYGRNLNTYQTNTQNALNAYNTSRQNAIGIYNTNYQTQYQDPYSINYNNALMQNSNAMAGYQTAASAALKGPGELFNQQERSWLDNYNAWFDNKKLISDNANRVADRGAGLI